MSLIRRRFSDALRRIRSLLGLDILHEATLRANPPLYIQSVELFESARASRRCDQGPIDKAERRRLLMCIAIIEGASELLG